VDANTARDFPRRALKAVSSFLDIRPGDGLPLVFLLGHSFLKGVGRVFFEAPANTLFLNKFSTARLPLVYIAAAVVSTIIGLCYAKLEEKSTARVLLTSTLIFLAATTGLLYLALLLTGNPRLAMVAMIWKDVNWTLMSVEFWALAGLLLDVRQGKRLLGLITGGEIVGGIISGFSVPLVVKIGGTLSLLLISFAAVSANVVFLIYTFRVFRDRGTNPGEGESGEPEERRSLLSMFTDRYLSMFFAVSVFSYFGGYFIEYVFYGQVESAFPGEARLASFFGLFYGLLGLGQLISSASVGSLLTRYGLGLGLLLLPLTDFATTGIAAVAGSFRGLATLVLGAVVAAKLLDEVLKQTVEMPSFALLYQPLPRSSRLRAQAVRESIVEPVAIGLCGVLLYLFRSILHLSATWVLLVTAGTCAVWAVLGLLLRKEYTVRLVQALTARRLDGGDLSLHDPSVEPALRKGLRSPKAGQVIYSLTMLDQAGHKLTDGDLIELLSHPQPSVRRHVLRQMEARPSAEALAAVTDRLAVEEDPAIRGDILRTICALGEGATVDRVIPYLSDPVPEVREGALTGLLRHCGIDGALHGGSHLNAMLHSPDPAERTLGAQVLGDIGIAGYYRPLLPLLADGDNGVRRTAIHSIRRLGSRRALPELVEALSVPAIRAAAFEALASFGDEVLPFVERTLGDAGLPRALRTSMARLAGKVRSHGCAQVLMKHIADPDGTVRAQVFASLVHCPEGHRLMRAVSVSGLVEREIGDAAWMLAALADIPERGETAPLRRALRQEVEERRNRVFLILSSVYSRHLIERARLSLRSGATERRSQAIEALDNVLPRELKATLLPLIDNISDSERLDRLGFRFPPKLLGAKARTEEIIVQPAGVLLGWTRACAIFAVSHDSKGDWSGVLKSAVSDPEAIVSETAAWALAEIGPSRKKVITAHH
jgi:HEAT repeat protein